MGQNVCSQGDRGNYKQVLDIKYIKTITHKMGSRER